MKYQNLALMGVLLGLHSITLEAAENFAKDKKQQSKTAPSLGDKLPPYTNPNRCEMEVSFIYWQASEDGLEYGTAEDTQELIVPDLGGLTTNPNVGYSLAGSMKDQKMDFSWNPGFKAGVGVIFGERDQWDLFLDWTWLQSTADGSFKGSQSFIREIASDSLTLDPKTTTQQYLTPSWSPIALGGPAANAKSHWRLHYNTIDLELGRNFFLSKNLTLRPHIGLRGAFLHQHVKVRYDSILNVVIPQISGVDFISDLFQTSSPGNRFKGESNYDGAGLRGGLDANWNFINYFSVYGKVSGAILYGRFEVDESFKSKNIINVSIPDDPLGNFVLTNAYDLSLDDNFHRARSTVQIALGMTWHTEFNQDKQHLFLSLGYEFNQWYQQNELRELILSKTPGTLLVAADKVDYTAMNIENSFVKETETVRRQGDLTLQGLTFDVRFDF